jgi:glucose/arabinose dehydrogenase
MRRLLPALLPLLLSAAAVAAPSDQQPGTRIEVRPDDMPAPHPTASVSNAPRRVARPEGVVPRVPDGFTANLFAAWLSHPRSLAVAANGDVLLSEPRAEQITLLRDADGDGVAEFKAPFLVGFRDLRGLAIHGDSLYITDEQRVWRLRYHPGETRNGARPRPLTGVRSLGRGGGHASRNIAFAPDGRHFYVTIGSRGNIGEEPSPRATVQRFDADGGGQQTFADGLRNPVGIAFRPGTDNPYVVVNERDGMGDDLVPDYLTRLTPGGFYGWPYAYIGSNPQPRFAKKRPDRVAAAASSSTTAINSRRPIVATPSSPSTARGTQGSRAAIRWSGCPSTATARRAITRSSPAASGTPGPGAPRSGGGRRGSPSPPTAASSSPTTPAARCGGSPIPASSASYSAASGASVTARRWISGICSMLKTTVSGR